MLNISSSLTTFCTCRAGAPRRAPRQPPVNPSPSPASQQQLPSPPHQLLHPSSSLLLSPAHGSQPSMSLSLCQRAPNQPQQRLDLLRACTWALQRQEAPGWGRGLAGGWPGRTKTTSWSRGWCTPSWSWWARAAAARSSRCAAGLLGGTMWTMLGQELTGRRSGC